MLQNKEHCSLRSVHDPLLEMTNGLSCLLNFFYCSFYCSLRAQECESLPLRAILLGLLRKGGQWWTRKSIVWQLTVRECLVLARVPRTRRSKPQWTSVHKRFRLRVRPSRRPVLECKQDRVQRLDICCVHLLTLCCVRNVSPWTDGTHVHAHHKHIKVDRWTRTLQHGPCQFSPNYTWQPDT